MRRSGGSLRRTQREGRPCARPEACLGAQHHFRSSDVGSASLGRPVCRSQLPPRLCGPVGPECSDQVMAGVGGGL